MQPEPRADPATNNPSDSGAHSDSSVEPTTLTYMQRGVIGNQRSMGSRTALWGSQSPSGFELDVSGGSPPPRIVGLRHPARVDQGEALT